MKVPNFIKPLDIDKERESILNEFKQKSGKLDYIPLIGDDYVTLTDIFLYRLNNFIELLNIRISQNYINFSSGDYLDELVALIGITRHDEVKPIAELEITVSSPTFLPKGTKFTDGTGHNAFLMQGINIADKAKVKIEADSYFKQNYETTIQEIPNIYISSIAQTQPFSGFKARESDEELRKRFLLALHRFSTAGSAKSYLFHILNTEGIKKANVYHLSPGVVQVVFLSDYETQIAISKISEALSDKVPLTDDVRIKEARKISVDLNIEVTPMADFMFSEILANANAKLKELFSTLQIAQTLHQSKIIDVAFDENVRAVEVKSQIPTVNRDEILVLNSLIITKANHA
ncbi:MULTISPECIES: baseplate J/gp47 family protein [unclassified Campylobacter]|uniref:baseplate J/gp47 family protein n=1 Tax=unclassified Campylobacter TaxID=2593542 RepID=UPI003D339BDA